MSAIYLVSYFVLTLFGDYVDPSVFVTTTCVGSVYSEVWQPVFIRRIEYVDHWGSRGMRGNLLGKVYAPLVALDSWLWHKPTNRPDPPNPGVERARGD